MVRGYNDYSVVSSEGKALVYVGKATRRNNTGDNYYPQDEIGARKAYFLGGNMDSYYSGWWDGQYHSGGWSPNTTEYGYYSLLCTGEAGCSPTTSYREILDELGYWVYTISGCASTPTVFIHSSTAGYVANVISITRIGSTSQYEIRIIVEFPLGQRAQAESKLTLYCFHTLPSLPSGSEQHGLQLFNKDGDLTYSSDEKLAVVGDVFQINSVSGNTDTASVNAGTLSSPPSSAYTMSKPAVMSRDWCRPSEVEIIKYTTANYDGEGYDTGCESPNVKKTIRYKMNYIFLGVRFPYGGSTPDLSIAPTAVVEYRCGLPDATETTTTDWNTIEMPVLFPIIDGSLYD